MSTYEVSSIKHVARKFHVVVVQQQEGDIGGYPIPQYRKKKWQIPKYRVENRLNTDTAYFNHIYNRLRILYGCFHLARLIISGIYAPDVHVFFRYFGSSQFSANFH